MNFQKICVLGLDILDFLQPRRLPRTDSQWSAWISTGISSIRCGMGISIFTSLVCGCSSNRRSIGNLTVSLQPEEADAFLIAVPTPFYEDQHGRYEGRTYRLADMRAVTSATEAILPYLRKGNLVVLESTSPPRTTVDLVRPILERTGLKRVWTSIFAIRRNGCCPDRSCAS